MRIATITNYAYIATVVLTLTSGVALFMASGAEHKERDTVAQSRTFDTLIDDLEREAFALSDMARDAVIKFTPETVQSWKTRLEQDVNLENRLVALRDSGASDEEILILRDGLTTLDQLEEEQRIAIEGVQNGKAVDGVNLLFSGSYEEKLEEAEYRFAHFRSLVDQRTQATIKEATTLSLRLRTLSEVMVGVTALLFLFVLGFIIKHRILRPVVTLSDVVNRLATQDYNVEAPVLAQVDEIGDMAQAIHIFRENGLARQRLEQERDKEWATRTLLARMTQRLQGCDTHSAIFRVVDRFAPQIIPEMGGRLYVLNTRTNRMKCVVRWGLPPGEDATFPAEHCWALKRGQLHSPGKDTVDMPCEHILPELASRAICVPLNAQNKSIGLLTFDNYTPGKEPPYAYLELLAETLALALANQILRDTLTERATYDSLTGLRNRYSLDETLRNMIDQAMVENSTLSCLMLDVDYFKKLNDQYGHEAGDKVLREMAKLITETLDENSIAFRYGGEEFLIILPGVDEAQAKIVAEALLHNVFNHHMLYESQDIGPVSVSIGLATWPRHARADNLVRAADLALYMAKEQGRGKIVVAKSAG
ncbi:sensor domain-containing diguanylate cyclase [Kosakonia oryzae]|uniref:diguanylate cyclase n=1 Tax=Kosakonia oryzae TaxID=497725 RepID=A0AA94H2D6_9ENTR|nr:sensor domain-containing diguanylate cyclase [Kosakonia oryzae]ANI82984.1 diguanylate cyclase [Kosakonia oryzae]SFC13625.1 diguanylate cyclase (GGDEF) domain-containing protein [Kosakonia oryzae]